MAEASGRQAAEEVASGQTGRQWIAAPITTKPFAEKSIMAQKYDSAYRPFTLAADTEAYVRVKLDGANANQVAIAGAGEVAIAVTDKAGKAGEVVNCKLIEGGEGTYKVTASGPIAANAALYGTASGRVDDAGGGTPQFTSLGAASGAGSIIEAAKRIDTAPSAVGAGGAVADQAALTVAAVAAATYAAPVIAHAAADAPAGGVGAAEGGWDTAGHRDTAIATINSLRAEVNELRTIVAQLAADRTSAVTQITAAAADLAAERAKLNALLAQLRIGGAIGA
jgi:hypothetical protein